ncbi:MAG: phosphate acyltransferase, partial [Deltaproteobacteria bacterium]|nr:phosphate acyltransferase [Deltaproteobacteria bacterium]
AKGQTVFIDVGANVDCRPSHLLQFAIMAEAFAKGVLHVENPSVGLLSIGEEDTKGNELVLAAGELLRNSDLNFIGNVEGRDILMGKADIIVCDGFVGNVCLKLAESMAYAMRKLMSQEMKGDYLSRLGYLLLKSGFNRFKRRIDYAEYGGAPLLGINGAGIISHGVSSSKAIKNAHLAADEYIKNGVNDVLIERLKQYHTRDDKV